MMIQLDTLRAFIFNCPEIVKTASGNSVLHNKTGTLVATASYTIKQEQ